MIARIDRLVAGLAFAMAMLGGAALLAMMALTVISVSGRALGLGPVPGDFELVEAGTAFAVMAFLPWCQWKRGHVTVDIVLGRFGDRFNAWVDVIGNTLMTVAALLIAWRLGAGLADKRGGGAFLETSFILGFPVWWGYAAAMSGALTFAAVCAWTVNRSYREARGA